MKSDPTIAAAFVKEEVETLAEVANIDTTTEDIDAEIPEEVKKELDTEIENIEK